jgi:tetratricopeptide (TPR) repeat protein
MRTAICFLTLLAAAPDAAGGWARVRGGRLEVLAEGGAKTALSVYREMRRTEQALASLISPLPRSAPAVRVFVFGGAREFAQYKKGSATKGMYQSGPERDYILLLGTSEDTFRASRHEYAHLFLNHTAGRIPQWLEEGLAEFYSTLAWEGGLLRVGRVIPSHIQLLQLQPWIEEEVFPQSRQVLEAHLDASATGVYYAQAWALTHYLLHGLGDRGLVARFAAELAGGLSQEAAFEKVFGRTLGAALRQARRYVESNRFRVASVDIGPAPIGEDPPVTPVDDAELVALRADLFVATGRPAEARRLYEEFVRRSPRDPRAVAGLGLVAMREEKYEEARARLEEAIRLGSTEASTHFEYAMLLRDQRGPEELVVKNLLEAVRLNPSFAEAWFLLGTSALRRNQPWEAIEALERAAEILPRQSVFWENLARAYLASNQREDARRAALRAVASAQNFQENEQARAVLRAVDEKKERARPVRPEVVTPESWKQPEAPRSVEGRLLSVDCSGREIVFRIEGGSGVFTLKAEDPSRVRSTDPHGAPREIRCGPQTPAPLVRAGFRTETNELLTLEFK